MKTLKATIRWKDNQEEQQVTFAIGKENVNNDDNIFYYLDDEAELGLGFTDFEVITIND